jgi:hypothetical protein
VLVRPRSRPLAALEAKFDGGVDAALEGLSERQRLVLVVDQFEELFVACTDEPERAASVDALVTAVADPDRRAIVVLGVRADFYGRCAAHPELADLLSGRTVLPRPMTRAALERAIGEPARRGGLEVEPALTDALAGEVADALGGLPLLSSTLLELWKRRDGTRLTLAAYRETGGVEASVSRLAEGACAALDERERAAAGRVLLRLAGEEKRTLVGRQLPLDRATAADGQSRQCRAGARMHCCVTGRGSAAGSRRTPTAADCTDTSCTGRASGTQAGATRPSSTPAHAWRRHWCGRRAIPRRSTRSSARSCTPRARNRIANRRASPWCVRHRLGHRAVLRLRMTTTVTTAARAQGAASLRFDIVGLYRVPPVVAREAKRAALARPEIRPGLSRQRSRRADAVRLVEVEVEVVEARVAAVPTFSHPVGRCVRSSASRHRPVRGDRWRARVCARWAASVQRGLCTSSGRPGAGWCGRAAAERDRVV